MPNRGNGLADAGTPDQPKGNCGKSASARCIGFCRNSSVTSNFGGFMNLEISKGILKNCGCGCPFSRIHDFCVGITMLFVNDHEKGGDNHVGGYHS